MSEKERRLQLSRPLSVSAASGAIIGAQIAFSFAVRIVTSTTVIADRIAIPTRGPNGAQFDVICAGPGTKIAPGAEFVCSGSTTLSGAGTVNYGADWLETTGAWHEGQLGPQQALAVSVR